MERKTVLITGAGRRIGKSLALHLASQGWDVAIHCRRSKQEAMETANEIASMGRNSAVIAADLSDDGALRRIVPEATDQLGPLTLLINNASLFDRDRFGHVTLETWRAHHDINLYAPLVLSQSFAAQLPTNAAGQIIQITDATAEWSVAGDFFSYGMSKLALQTLTRQLALLLAPRIRVNALALGPTLPGAQDGPETFVELAKRMPLRHTGSLDEVHAALDFLLAATSVTGESIALAGGVRVTGA